MSSREAAVWAVLAFWLWLSVRALRSLRRDQQQHDPRLAYGPVQHVVKSGDYTDTELETLRPILAAVPISEWPDIVAEYRAQVLHEELDDDAAVAEWLESGR